MPTRAGVLIAKEGWCLIPPRGLGVAQCQGEGDTQCQQGGCSMLRSGEVLDANEGGGCYMAMRRGNHDKGWNCSLLMWGCLMPTRGVLNANEGGCSMPIREGEEGA